MEIIGEIVVKLIEKTIKLEDKKKPLVVVPFGDVHIGANGCNKEYFENTIKWIKNKPNCYAIAMGDLVDCIIMNDKRFDIKGVDKDFLPHLDNLPMAQMDYLKKILEPIKDKILCAIPGNHEDKFRTEHGVDVMYELHRDIEITISDYMTFLRIKFDKSQFHTTPIIFWLQHGFFSGRKMGGKLNNLTDVANSYDADVYCVGHSHDLFAATTEKLCLVSSGSSIIKEKKIFCNTGSFVETTISGGTSYAEKKAYPVAKIGTVRLDIYPQRKISVMNGARLYRPDIHIRI